MSLTQPETQALGAIADGLAGADPRLASMLTIFSRLAAGEEMPAREKREQLGHTRAVTRPPAAVPVRCCGLRRSRWPRFSRLLLPCPTWPGASRQCRSSA